MPPSRSKLSIGLPGATPHELIRQLAPRIEQTGFGALWLNDTPDGDSLGGLAVAAEVTSSLRLASGVMPVSRLSAEAILARVASLALPFERLTLGIGSGNARPALAAVRENLSRLREATDARVFVGALGPRMRRLAAEEADGVLFSWLTPAALADAMAELRSQASTVDREPHGALYLRAIIDADARTALEAEASRYQGVPSYAANFERLGISAIDATVDGSIEGKPGLEVSLRPYRDLADEVVVRVITSDNSLEAYRRFIDIAGEAA